MQLMYIFSSVIVMLLELELYKLLDIFCLELAIMSSFFVCFVVFVNLLFRNNISIMVFSYHIIIFSYCIGS